jgi:hypothetical protein
MVLAIEILYRRRRDRMKNKDIEKLLQGSEKTFLLVTPNGIAVDGTTSEVMTLLSCAIKGLREDIPDEMLKHAFELAFKSEEELKILTLEAMKNMIDILGGTNE